MGALEGRDPHPLFDSDWYLEQNRDVAAAGLNPLVHYLRWGAAEGRDPHPLFDSDWYLDKTEMSAAGLNPLVHYLRWGPRRAAILIRYSTATGTWTKPRCRGCWY